MARIRSIKPEFWDSPDTARASLRTRLFYIAMWNWSDDYGKGTASAKQLVGFAFPNDDDISVADYPSLAKDVAECFGVVFYTVDRRPFYFIPNFDKHQRTEKRAVCRIPDPPDDITAGQVPWCESAVGSDGSSAPSKGSTVSGTGEQGNRGKGTGEQFSSSNKLDKTGTDRFDAFWQAYDKKVGKGAAEKAWAKAIKTTDPDVIVTAAHQHTDWHEREKTEAKYIPHASKWLNEKRWADERGTAAKPKVDPNWALR